MVEVVRICLTKEAFLVYYSVRRSIKCVTICNSSILLAFIPSDIGGIILPLCPVAELLLWRSAAEKSLEKLRAHYRIFPELIVGFFFASNYMVQDMNIKQATSRLRENRPKLCFKRIARFYSLDIYDENNDDTPGAYIAIAEFVSMTSVNNLPDVVMKG